VAVATAVAAVALAITAVAFFVVRADRVETVPPQPAGPGRIGPVTVPSAAAAPFLLAGTQVGSSPARSAFGQTL